MTNSNMAKDNQHLLVLAGGFGTRLRSAVSDVPKPMAPVAEQPFLGYLIESWVNQGVRKFTFLLHHQADLIEEYVRSEPIQKLLVDCNVDFIREPHAMGTGGAIAYAVQQNAVEGRFMVANADTWLGSGLAQLSHTRPPALGAVLVEDCSRYGSLEVEKGKIVAFLEKKSVTQPGLINAGVYCLHSDLFTDWDGQPFSLEAVTFPQLVEQRSLSFIELNTDFIDIGIPKDYFHFCSWIESGREGCL